MPLVTEVAAGVARAGEGSGSGGGSGGVLVFVGV